MRNQYLAQKVNYIKWLDAIGVEYYWSEAKRSVKTKKLTNLVAKVKEDYKTPPLPETTEDKIILSIESSLKSNVPLISNTIDSSRSLADKANTLDELKEIILKFEGCDLKKLATNTVFSDGNPKGPLMFIGEAPGNSEDLAGIPFCGESGKLLDHMLASIGISRKDNAYITNTVFWRPPANRTPTQEEVDICRPFVEKHIALINPHLIVLVGNVAATSLLGKNAGISKIRQEYYSYTNRYLTKPIQTTAIFHPAYLLRQPMQKKTTWYDLLKIQEFVKG